MGAKTKTTPADLDGAEQKPKKQPTTKGNSKAKNRAQGKMQQALRRQRKLEKLLKQAIRKKAQLTTRGKSVTGINKAIDQLEYALVTGHKTSVTKDGIVGGGKKSPVDTENFNPPHHRPRGFWKQHQRVWSSLAKNLGCDNGEIVTNQRVQKYFESLEPTKTEEVSA